MKYILLLCSFFSILLGSEEESVKRVHSHLLIQDYHSALLECQTSLESYPDSEVLQKAYVETLSKSGKGVEAIKFWKDCGLQKKHHDPELIETVAWGILSSSENSSQFVVNITSLMSAFLTDDIRAVKMILNQLNSSNAILRATAAQLSSHYRDINLIKELKRLLIEEKNWFVRLEVIQSLGLMEVKDIKEPLTKIICHSRTTIEEKAVAIESLVSIYENIGDQEFLKLIESKRAGLRHLACQIVSHLNLKEKRLKIINLLEDPASHVRIAALNTLYFLGLKDLNPLDLSKIIDLTNDSNFSVALTAAWIVSRFAPEISLQTLRKYIYSTDDTSRRLAAYILGRIGRYGLQLNKEVMTVTPDPFVKANIALGMIGQGETVTCATDVLYTFLLLRKGKVMWDTSMNPFFEVLSPSTVCHVPQIPQYPNMVDHITRLDILSRLAILGHPQAEKAIKNFLNHHILGVTYSASTTLLEEGGEETSKILYHLLKEEDINVRVQAALVLALSGEGTEAIKVLQEAYKKVDRDMKVNILGALGHIGDKASIPFLIDLLEEPYQILKIVAASALIQCVYN